MATNDPSGAGCNTVGHDENDEGGGGNRYYYGRIKNSVFYDENSQKD